METNNLILLIIGLTVGVLNYIAQMRERRLAAAARPTRRPHGFSAPAGALG